ncbi:MAG: TIGR00282 family metallophosphoesterase [Pseudomonadota bacterium]|uniref:TIGR00282 family metallophosphoesterase n=1 Tax=Thermithiobacillus tepidarius TaxID=929 RepID=UPI0004154CFB|nr:TIGR00282 family metallophosphoesterase [Thermithiobacillus tepidarius]
MNLLFVGDVVGEPGRRVLLNNLRQLKDKLALDFIVVNAENAAGGFGVTEKICLELFEQEVDVITSGNHIWDKREALTYIVGEPRLLRPHNYPVGTPGSGWYVGETAAGDKVGVLNLMGQAFMHPSLECPFAAADAVLAERPADLKMILVDMHCETTSEKTAMGWHLDGRVSAVVGTHTHIPTADERILPQGTGYITDVGMTGTYDSVIGMHKDKTVKRFLSKLPERLETASGPATLSAVFIQLDADSGRCHGIKRVRIAE